MYLDPSFGGMLIQIIIAIIAAGGVILFSMRRKIFKLIKNDKAQPPIIHNTNDNRDEVIDMMEKKEK